MDSGRTSWSFPTNESAVVDVPSSPIESPEPELPSVPDPLPSVVLGGALGQLLFTLVLSVDGEEHPLQLRGGENATAATIRWCEKYRGNKDQAHIVLDEISRRFEEYEMHSRSAASLDASEVAERKALVSRFPLSAATTPLASDLPTRKKLFSLTVIGNKKPFPLAVYAGDTPLQLAEDFCNKHSLNLAEVPIVAALVLRQYTDVWQWEQSWFDELAYTVVALLFGFVAVKLWGKIPHAQKPAKAPVAGPLPVLPHTTQVVHVVLLLYP